MTPPKEENPEDRKRIKKLSEELIKIWQERTAEQRRISESVKKHYLIGEQDEAQTGIKRFL